MARNRTQTPAGATPDNHIREAIARLPHRRATAIRDAYYKATEGLQALATELEAGDLDVDGVHDHVLIAEHLVACAALEAMDKSRLGETL